MRFYGGKYLIYTKSNLYSEYKILESDKVKVDVAPIENFMNKWDKALYLPSTRGQDPSPRVIAECEYYNKKLIYKDLGKLHDGAYYRMIDIMNGMNNITLTENDEIFDIVDEYL